MKTLSGFNHRRVLHQKFFINDRAYIMVDVLRLNKRIFESVLQQYIGDLTFANSLRYAIELIGEIETAVKTKNVIVATSSYRRYASHWNETLRKMIRARNVRMAL